MIKTVTEYVAICDNTYCNSVINSVVDFHSDGRRQRFELQIMKLGWKFEEDKNSTVLPKIICPNCLLFTSELEKEYIGATKRVKPVEALYINRGEAAVDV